MADDESWIYELGATLTTELERELCRAKAAGLRHSDLSPASFPLPSAGGLLASIIDQLEHGRGVALLRGFPVARKSVEDCELLYAGLASHFGTSIVQDTLGTLIDQVADRGLSYENIAVRGYMTHAQLTPHCDSGDLVTLLCVHQARRGGVNTVSSSLSVYNEIRAKYPERLDVLHRGFFYNIRGNGPPGKYRDVTSHRVPVYLYHEGRLSCRFNEKAILTSEQLPGVPPMTETERSTVRLVAELAMDPRFCIELRLEPGDMLLLCNHTVFHNRSSFDDGEDDSERRLLLRKWINLDAGRDLTWEFGDHYNTGIRQGPFVAERPSEAVDPAPAG
jgi:alpha-ketoglutarate-dependent taurine dioxygenase